MGRSAPDAVKRGPSRISIGAADTALRPGASPCRREYDAGYYKLTRERRRELKRARRIEFVEWYLSLKDGKPCAVCGGVFHPAAMQWDHLPGTGKNGNVGDIQRRSARARVLAEIAKCELVCANCHSIRTFQRRGA
jgi:hypothetical protein